MHRVITFAAIVVLLAAVAAPAAAAEPANVQQVPPTPFPIFLTPTPYGLAASGGGSYSGHIVFVPIRDSNILPHGQMENSRFDFSFSGVLFLLVDGTSIPLACAGSFNPVTSECTPSTVTGHVMVQLHPPLPNDPGPITLPIIGLTVPKVTPYSFTVVLDQPLTVLVPGLTGSFSKLKITDGKLLFVR